MSDPATEPSATSRPPTGRWLVGAGALAAAVCLGFAAFTGHMWEDYFITFRASLNLATGHGLVFQEGERVHTFTSPLGTLLPAVFALPGGENVAVHALWLFRVVSALALGAAVWLVAEGMRGAAVGALAAGAACGAIALDPKIVDFSINGMETAWLVFFVIVTWRAFTGGARLLPCALAFAGLQWTRPDGCVFFGALAAAWLVCGAAPATTIPARVGSIVRGIVLGAMLYLPWVVIAWIYYGTPVPHTIMAKVSHHAPGELPWALALYPWRLLAGHAALHNIFQPTYFFFGGWPEGLGWLSRIIVVGGALGWLVPGVRPAGRIASAAFFLGGFYVEYIPRSPWYYPGWQVLALVAWGYLLDAALRRADSPRWSGPAVRRFAGLAACGLVGLQAALLAGTAWEMRTQQAIIEDGHRREIGLWLRAQARPGDRVYLEPLGYIGYFSGLKMLDYPGLASPEVVAARRAGKRPHAEIIAALRPEWLVLRPDQVQGIIAEQPKLLHEQYVLARTFDARAQVDAVKILPGRGYLEFDALYFVFHRIPGAPP